MKLLAIVRILAATNAFAASAFWTGRMEFVTTVTYQQAIRCQYNYLGRTFWQLFSAGNSCPSSVEVE